MDKKKICFVAQFPPPLHGLSKAVETLYGSNLNTDFDFEKIDITNNRKFIKNIIAIQKSKADLFYFTISQTKMGNLRDLMILKVLKQTKKKSVIHLHGGYYRTLVDNMIGWQKRANYRAVKHVDGAIVLGASLEWIFKGMLPDDKIHTVPNCVDNQYLISDMDFDEKISKINERKTVHILYLSNFIRTKGYAEVLELARYEKERVEAGGERKFHFDFAGKFFEETERVFFENYVNEYDLKQYVSYHGIVQGEQKQNLLKNSLVFILPTRYPNEGQPISILEAMGNGMMIVTTDHAGIGDVVKDGTNGIVMSKDNLDMKQCYMKVLRLLEDEEQVKRIIYNNRLKVCNSYTESQYVQKMLTVFGKII